MGTWQWLLDLVVAALLTATLLRARRLERALNRLREDRGGLEALLASFDASAQAARAGLERMRETADGARKRAEHQQAAALALKDDLALLISRGEPLAERLDQALRASRSVVPPAAASRPTRAPEPATSAPEREPRPDAARVRSQAERDLLLALQARN